MNAYEFLTKKNNGKTPDELVINGDWLNANWVVTLLEEYVETKVKNCNTPAVGVTLPTECIHKDNEHKFCFEVNKCKKCMQ